MDLKNQFAILNALLSPAYRLFFPQVAHVVLVHVILVHLVGPG